MLLTSSQNYLNYVNTQPILSSLTPKEARNLRKNTAIKVQSPYVEIQDLEITTRDGASIIVRNYEPRDGQYEAAILYIHGGGWVINSIETSNQSCIEIVKKTGYRVVSVDYRLAPEFKFPIPLNDCHDAFLWLYNDEQARTLLSGKDIPIFVAGDSAGGNLASALVQLPYGQEIAGQILLYPVASLTYDTNSYHEFSQGYGLEKSVMEWFGQHYIENEEDRFNVKVSLLNAKLDYAPPAFVVVAQYDVLRDEGIAYAEKLAQVNGQSQLVVKGGLVHSYFTRNDFFSQEIAETIEEIDQFIQAVI